MTGGTCWAHMRKALRKRRLENIGQCASAFIADLVRVEVKFNDRAVGLSFLTLGPPRLPFRRK